MIGLLLVAAVVGTGYFQQKQMTARLPKDSINPQMQMVTKIFPVFFGLISLSVPAGVVLYFVVSNLWQIGQQAVAFRNRETGRCRWTTHRSRPGSRWRAAGGQGWRLGPKSGGPDRQGWRAGRPRVAAPKEWWIEREGWRRAGQGRRSTAKGGGGQDGEGRPGRQESGAGRRRRDPASEWTGDAQGWGQDQWKGHAQGRAGAASPRRPPARRGGRRLRRISRHGRRGDWIGGAARRTGSPGGAACPR